MNPRIVAIEGPRCGEVFPMSSDEVSFGRDPANRICIGEASVSRRHCLVKLEQDGIFYISDLGSYNGTFVNGLPARKHALEHGDQIRIGGSLFQFLTEDSEPQIDSSIVLFSDEKLNSETMVRLRNEDSFYVSPDAIVAGSIPSAALARAFRTLLRLSTAVHSSRGLEALSRQILQVLFEAIPAERGAVLIFGETLEDPYSAFSCDRRGSASPVEVCRELVERAAKERVAILTHRARSATVRENDRNVPTRPIHAALAVPLVHFEKKLGVLYLDASDPQISFDRDHLQLLSAAGLIVAASVNSSLEREILRAENQRLLAEIDIEHDMIGESAGTREIYQFVSRAAPTDSTILICGETGTGKELVARAIHRNSRRARKPFVAINCAALTETLLESELFGHEKGAFTGAVVQKKGRLEVADGGSIFLDEVGELPLPLQAKLLRVLQERAFERVGGTRLIKVDIRIIAATNRDLKALIAKGLFREDLFYRLNVVSIAVLPLRERRDDIVPLAEFFAGRLAKRTARGLRGISEEARSCLMAYSWPGNIRELENAIERAVVLGVSDSILPEDLPEAVTEASPSATVLPAGYLSAIQREKRELVLAAIEQSGGNITEAARRLKLHPNSLHRLIRNLGIRDSIK